LIRHWTIAAPPLVQSAFRDVPNEPFNAIVRLCQDKTMIVGRSRAASSSAAGPSGQARGLNMLLRKRHTPCASGIDLGRRQRE
jgi:hypothetical protein